MLIIFLTLSFSGNTLAASPFKDVSTKEWSYPIVVELANAGVIQGYSDGTFRPSVAVTRAQSAIYIGRALNIDTQNRPDPGFRDVNKQTTGYAYIAALVDEGVYSKGNLFNPYESLSRAQMAKILVLAFDLTGTKKTSFTDLPTNGWAKPYVESLLKNGVTTGTSATKFSPDQVVNRLQMAIFIYRTLHIGEEVIMPPTEVNDSPSTAKLQELLTLVNAERVKNGLKELEYAPNVEKLAMIKAEDMRNNNYFAHNSPTYGSPSKMLTDFKVAWTASGENIAAGQSTVSGVHTGWMNSAGHRANILNSNFTHIGFGYAEGGGDYGRYWVQMFIKN
jgi:uncharacterized YkwD family protein